MDNKEIHEFSIKELFSQDTNYLIPIYQRNYAWTKTEVEQLVMDILDFSEKKSTQNYYIGSLVVFEKEVNSKRVFETIDGQQRLTTISILLSVLKNEYKYLDFTLKRLLNYESREISTTTLHRIYNGDIGVENLNPRMESAYKTIRDYLKKLNDHIKIENFKKFLFDNVKILRVKVPKDTDLNHYFEIMNNRGEQLEKHEVLKARMLEKLTNDYDKKTFNHIWETCSDMYRYVQYGFLPDLRDKIFGNEWSEFICRDFDEIKNKLFTKINNENLKHKSSNKCSFTIDDILEGKYENIENITNKDRNDIPDRFTSPINFQNFLLHVLKITHNKNISLDDKSLLESFENIDEDFVKNFGFNILKIRYLFDNYIIKREYTSNADRWSLQQAYKYTYENGNRKQQNIQYKNRFENEDENKKVLMLISMFHVSNPSQVYKYWLTGVLNYLNNDFEDFEINLDSYINYLENLAKCFFRNRYLANEPQSFDEIIFNNLNINNNIDMSKLNQGTLVEHFIFNYLDYLLWNKYKNINEYNFDYFNFSFSNSVEHFYPQNPIEGHKKINNIDNFGNLCLISVSKNAKLNNHPPKSKKEYYLNGQYDSLKQHVMMKNSDNWDEDSIKNHNFKMLEILELIKL
ncbi:DUF262 domain-containing HNH endonuclease family protein [Aliarcobacter butzleri]|uniref:DUF262 domain-containing protein n=1 Tax=Aliarcobacter butzleri TaxID=28197 RepID=UPI00263E7DA1|nr:DUF262 domain-containing HNH endonuclease family protein [Aliarcobacter butzleri]MDN5046622.1 DUF262 domain-containing HNH endonuclease family protein [Aliarcobacter butzleri]